jgi:hypothetical protein
MGSGNGDGLLTLCVTARLIAYCMPHCTTFRHRFPGPYSAGTAAFAFPVYRSSGTVSLPPVTAFWALTLRPRGLNFFCSEAQYSVPASPHRLPGPHSSPFAIFAPPLAGAPVRPQREEDRRDDG